MNSLFRRSLLPCECVSVVFVRDLTWNWRLLNVWRVWAGCNIWTWMLTTWASWRRVPSRIWKVCLTWSSVATRWPSCTTWIFSPPDPPPSTCRRPFSSAFPKSSRATSATYDCQVTSITTTPLHLCFNPGLIISKAKFFVR